MKDSELLKTTEALAELIKEKKGKVNPAEAALATGYSLDDINEGFARLLELYESKVSIDKANGFIYFDFEFPLVPRGKRTFKEVFYSIASKAYKVFKVVYKAAIAVVLVAYALIFAIILIALAFSGGDRDRKGIGFDAVINIFLAIVRGMQIAAISSDMIEYAEGDDGMKYKRLKDRGPQKGFISSVYDFVFGPERVKSDPLSDAKEAIAYLKKISQGKLTASSILLLAGGNFETAENKLAEYVGRYKGDLFIDSNGVLQAEFHNLEKVDANLLEGKIIYYFDESEPPWVMNGNSIGKNLGIIFLNLFNLFVSANFVVFSLEPGSGMDLFINIGLGFFPFTFSLMFFLIPLLRIPYTLLKKIERNKSIIRKKLFRGIMRTIKTQATKDEIFSIGGISSDEASKADKILEELLNDLQGTINISESGTPVYEFERLRNELKIS